MQNKPDNNQFERDDRLRRLPSVGELERLLGQAIGRLYRKLTGQQPHRVVCHFFANSVGILIEQSITPVEELLLNAAQFDLANQVRLCINSAIRQQVKETSEQELDIAVRAVLVDSVFGTGHTGIFVMLANAPNVRNPTAIPKTDLGRKAKRQLREDRNGDSVSSKTE